MSFTETTPGQHSHGAGTQGTGSSRADRPTSFNVTDIAVPSGREEDWRFTPLARIETLFDPANYANHTAPVTVEADPEVTVKTVARDEVDAVLAPGDRTAVVAWDRAEDVTVIDIPAHTTVENPIIATITGTDSLLRAQRLTVRCGVGAEAVVVLNHRGSGQLNQTVEVDAADEAKLSVVSIQEWDDDSTHAANHRLSAGRGTQLRHIVVTLGGDLVRVCTDTDFTGERGHIEMLGLYFIDAGQHFEHRPYIAHTKPNCYSRVTYKGALQGHDAHCVWVGDCLIGRDADGTDTYELNRNLVLTEGTKVDSVPNLEIENGEIEGAGHASATGRFDDEQLFYLMSRGVSRLDARRLVVRGFFAELIGQIGIPAVEEHLMEAIEHELEIGGALEALETEAAQ